MSALVHLSAPPRCNFPIGCRLDGHRLLLARRSAQVLGAVSHAASLWSEAVRDAPRAHVARQYRVQSIGHAACSPPARLRVRESENWTLTTRVSTLLLTVLPMLLAGRMSSARAVAADTALVLRSTPRCHPRLGAGLGAHAR